MADSLQTTALMSFQTLGDLLRYLRRRARLTQRQLSIAVGYSESQISRLEQNERLLDEAILLAVFVPALGLEQEPEIIAQLLALTKTTRGGNRITEAAGRSAVSEPIPTMLGSADSSLLTNLPHRVTSFIGRTHETVSLRQHLATSRLVTLTGVGGVGKTSLAIEAARLAQFRDGVWLVELASVQVATFVPQLLIDTFKLTALSGRTPIDALTAYLQHKQLLLLLDNCEHLVSTCAEIVDRLLHACPSLHILATSREALNVDGEMEWLVTPLSTPTLPIDQSIRLTASAISDVEAIHLFLERAQAVKSEFGLTDQNAAPIAQICVQLDGIPLAIELAAARLKGLTVEQVAARLQDRFTLLTNGRRTVLLRQQTLRATIDWSYDLLTEPEKILFRRLAVFTDGWTLDAVAIMAEHGHTNNQTLALLLQLVNKSLVTAEARGKETRYRLLETIRQYATEKLREAGEERWAYECHFAYFLSLAEQSHDPSLSGRRLSNWLSQIVLEHGNLRNAFVWGREREDGGEGQLRLANALSFFWILRGGYDEGIHWLMEAVAQARMVSPVLRAIGLSRLADLEGRSGRNQSEMVEAALAIFMQADHKAGIGYCLVLKARTMVIDPSKRTQAVLYHQQALALFREIGHIVFTGHILCHIANALQLSGQPLQAATLYEECLVLGQKHEEITLVRRALNGLSSSDRSRALALCRAEITYQRNQGSQETTAAILEMFGRLLQDEGYYTEALPVLAECLALWRKLGVKWSDGSGIARALLDLGHNYFWLGDYLPAAIHLQEALQLYADVGDIRSMSWTQMMLGYIALRQNEIQQAIHYLCTSLQHSSDGNAAYVPFAFCGLGQAKYALGDALSACRFLGAAVRYGDNLSLFHAAGQASFGAAGQVSFLKILADARTLYTASVSLVGWTEDQAITVEQLLEDARAML